MAIFKKRETLTQNIAYMAIMAAINVVFTLITTLVPVLMVLLVLVLPLTNVVVTLYCKKRYFPIYAIVTVGLCLLVTMWDITETFFYVIPSIFSGFVFGVMIEKKIPAVFILMSTAIIQFGFTYAAIPFIKNVLGVDIIMIFAKAFGVSTFKYLDYLVPTFVAFMALAQSALAYIFIKSEIPKMGYSVTLEHDKYYFVIPLLTLLGIGLFALLAYLAPSFSYTFLIFALYFAIYLLVDLLIDSNIKIWISLFASLMVSIVLFACLYKFVPNPFGISLFMIFFVLSSIIAVLENYLFRTKANKGKMMEGTDNG